jgi:hypothetical protein
MRDFMRSSCRVSNYSWNLVELESRPVLGAVQVVQPTTPMMMASPAAKFALQIGRVEFPRVETIRNIQTTS